MYAHVIYTQNTLLYSESNHFSTRILILISLINYCIKLYYTNLNIILIKYIKIVKVLPNQQLGGP